MAQAGFTYRAGHMNCVRDYRPERAVPPYNRKYTATLTAFMLFHLNHDAGAST